MIKKKTREKITIFDNDVKWLKRIIEIVIKGHVELDNIKLKCKKTPEWSHLSFAYRVVNLKEDS